MTNENIAQFMKKASKYGLQEFLEIMGELSQESTKKGLLSRLHKELITLGLALYKNCQRCISIHTLAATKLEATDVQFSLVKKIIFFMNATPHGGSELWGDWKANWNDYSYSKVNERRQLREMVALAIAIVMQHEKQIELHMNAALDVGVSIEQIFEIVPLVMLMDGAPTLSQVPKIVACYEEYCG
ncbi:MAG: carboxymuconolactone decarboxylase family protein [Gammaproteobacteria bacterium]|nr:carboxymuconolactone decarboxylase family protein [Gammaproteobacteria bacterium]MCK5262252.1 carboxymuconolactone decarboxylase family protein [Gammaproteobacteria bacterium]